MAEKKVKVEHTPEPAPESPPEPKAPPKEKLLVVTVTTEFVDGNLREFFENYGYNGEKWPANEVRKIPLWLARRCEQSGATLERADD